MMETATDGADTMAITGFQAWTAGQIMLCRQMVSRPLRGGQSISGTVSAYMRVLESNADDEARTRFGVHVVSGDGATVRATLLAVGHHGTGTEYSRTTATSARFAHNTAISSYTTQAGDRIVVEVGHYDSTGTTPSVSSHIGSSSATDLDATEADTGGDNPWIEFSADIEFLNGGIDGVIEEGPDIVFYGEAPTPTAAELAVDLSGLLTDFSVSGSNIQELASARCNLTEYGSWEFIVNASNTANGLIYDYNSTNISLAIVTGFIYRLQIAGVTVGTITLGNSSATARPILLSCSMEPNPLTTGASDARIYYLTAYQPDFAASVQHEKFLGAAPSGTQGTARILNTGNITVSAARIGSAHHSTTEVQRCWVALASPTAEGAERREWQVPPSPAAIHDDGQFAGPAYILAGKALRTHDLRLWGPIVNEIFYGAWLEDSTQTMADPTSASYEMHFETLRHRPIPLTCNRVSVRVFVQQNGASALDLGVRCYSSNWPGPVVPGPDSQNEAITNRVTVVRNADDGTTNTVGAWVDLGLLEPVRDEGGRSYFWLGFNPSTLTDYRVRAWTIEPVL